METSERKIILSPVQRILGEDFNPTLLAIVLRKSILWVIIFMLVTISLAFTYLRYATPVYESSGTLIMQPQNAAATALNLPSSPFQTNPVTELINDVEVIKSQSVALGAVKNLPLKISYYNTGEIITTEMYQNSPFVVDAMVKDSSIYDVPIVFKFLNNKSCEITYQNNNSKYDFKFDLNKYFASPQFVIRVALDSDLNNTVSKNLMRGQFYFTINNRVALAKRIASHIVAQPINNTFILFYQDPQPRKAADIVNAILNQFIVYDQVRKSQSASNILNFLDNQLDTVSGQLEDYQGKMADFKKAHSLLNPEQMELEITTALKELQDKKNELQSDLNDLDYYKKTFLNQRDSASISLISLDQKFSNINTAIGYLHDLETTKKSLRVSLKTPHPKLQIIDQQIVEAENAIIINLNDVKNVLDYKQSLLEQEYDKYAGDLSNLPAIEEEFLKISNLSDLKEKYYLLLLDKKSEYEIEKAGFISDYSILRPAEVPHVPLSPNKALIRIMGLLSGLIIGIAFVTIRYLLNHNVLSVSEVERYCVAGVMGVIPKYNKPMDVSQLVVNKSPKSLISESFRSIRTNIDFLSATPGPKVIAVTSTVSSEGKTFISVNIAGILAVGGKRVVILDFDLRKPKLHKAFAAENSKGLTTVYIGKNNVEDCIQHSEWENLDFITSGPIPPNPAEFIMSKKTGEILEYLKTKYDIIVIDTPPVGMVTDAIELIRKADFPIYVIRADYSSRNFLNTINHFVTEMKITKLSVVMNDMGEGASGYSYNYGYSYGYGYGQGGKTGYHGYYTDDEKGGKKKKRFLFF